MTQISISKKNQVQLTPTQSHALQYVACVTLALNPLSYNSINRSKHRSFESSIPNVYTPPPSSIPTPTPTPTTTLLSHSHHHHHHHQPSGRRRRRRRRRIVRIRAKTRAFFLFRQSFRRVRPVQVLCIAIATRNFARSIQVGCCQFRVADR